MNRCLKTHPARLALAFSWLVPLALLAFQGASSAQTFPRVFPPKALRATLVVQTPPDVLLDGQSDRLSPGARIRDPRNMLTMSGALVGKELVVNYLRDSAGLIHEVWLLTPEEAATGEQSGASTGPRFNFNTAGDAEKPRRDDGKTPFNQLPVYPNR